MSSTTPTSTAPTRYYGVCYQDGRLIAIPDPQRNEYPGFVFGTLRMHPDAASAIDEYRQHVQEKTMEASDEPGDEA